MANIVWSPFHHSSQFHFFLTMQHSLWGLNSPGIEPGLLAVKFRSPNHETARECLQFNSYTCIYDGSIEMKKLRLRDVVWIAQNCRVGWIKKNLSSLCWLGGLEGVSKLLWMFVVGLWRRGLKHFFLPSLITPPPQRRVGTGGWEGAPRGPEPPPWTSMWCLELLGLLSRTVLPWWCHSL